MAAMPLTETVDESGLVARARSGDDQALEELLRRYAPRVRGLAGQYFHGRGGDADDLVQEGMIGLYKAVRGFDSSRGVPFAPFADLCVRRQLINAVRGVDRFEHAMPVDEAELGDSAGVGVAERATDPVRVVLARETLTELQRFLDAELSSLERAALELHAGGLTLRESAAHLSTGFKTVDNALQRARRKIECWPAPRASAVRADRVVVRAAS
jgi:RNA polymerase sporulation-specific sigma factor